MRSGGEEQGGRSGGGAGGNGGAGGGVGGTEDFGCVTMKFTLLMGSQFSIISHSATFN